MRKYKNRRITSKTSNSGKKRLASILFLILFLTFIFLVIVFFKVATLDKFIYINNQEGNAEIIIIDPQKKAPVKMFIDKEFNLNSTRNLGEYKLGSLWVLGEKENYHGRLVSETITKNFGTPIYLWKSKSSSNLNIFQKIKIFLIKTKVVNYDYFLTSKVVKDSVLVNFVHPATIDHLPKVKIDDLTGDKDVVNNVSKSLEVMGFKIVDYSKGYDELLDCEVVGKSIKYAQIFSDIFSCKISIDENQSADLNIRIGKIFADRF